MRKAPLTAWMNFFPIDELNINIDVEFNIIRDCKYSPNLASFIIFEYFCFKKRLKSAAVPAAGPGRMVFPQADPARLELICLRNRIGNESIA